MTTTITSTCACLAFSLKLNIPTSSLPINRAVCLCTTCRRLSGSCGNTYTGLPSTEPFDPSRYKLTSYTTSDALTRYFCGTCGAHVCLHHRPSDSWHLATGLWNRTEGIINWTGCKWVEDTKDGGVSIWLKEVVGADGERRQLKRWMLTDDNGELVPEGQLDSLLQTAARKPVGGDERLKAQCHCGGVRFYITRPSAESRKARSPFPDLVVSYRNNASSANPGNETWWLRDGDTKYLAGLCTCTSCRRSMGFEVQTWAFVPRCNIFQEDGRGLDFNMGTLKRYDSSEGNFREFCGTCGATVFWHCDERPDLIDVSVGLLDPEEGARVEGWLEWWTERVSFEELAVSRTLVRSLEDGLKIYGARKCED